jgi:predicted transcriptional regulator
MAPLSGPVELGTDISIARCRELLGDEAASMTDRDVEEIHRHALTMAHIVVEMYLAHREESE